jgi:nucleoside-diphosphate-sugar epimerase
VRIVITGSSGQIGTNLGLSLLEAGHEVIGYDKRPNAWTDRLDTRATDLVAIARRQAEWELPVGPVDAVVHLAAWAKVHQLVKHPELALENVEMSFAAAELARRLDAPIVFGSSREVYGDIHRHVTDEAMADFVVAESPYSASKIAGEALYSSYARCYDLPFLVFRFSNVYGRYDNDIDRMERVIPLFVRRITAGEPITVYGPGKMLDFTFVDDCVAGVQSGVEALVEGKVRNDTVNLAYGQGNTLTDLVNLIELVVGRDATVRHDTAQAGEVTRYVADISKARRLLGYDPKVPLSTGIRRYVAWCRETGFIPS